MAPFLPDRLFDAHAHLYRREWWDTPPALIGSGPEEGGLALYRACAEALLPRCRLQALVFGFPFATADEGATRRANEWVAAQVPEGGAALALVRPADDPDLVAEQVGRLGLRGLKPYHLHAPAQPTWEAEIPHYLPEPLMAHAEREGWVVTLHLVRRRGVADPSNQHWLRHYCETYPNVQFVLAHCARGFNPYHVLEGLPVLADLPNLWVDTSGVANALAVEACLRLLGPQRVLYGSDFPVSQLRGTNYPLGDTFLWVDDAAPPAAPAYAPHLQLPLLATECLRATAAAVRMARLSDAEIEGVFAGNALRLLGLK